jgi:hypothetical protein
MAKKRRKRAVIRHTATAEVHLHDLAKAGASININVYKDDEKIGEVIIGRGSLIWYGRKWKQGRKFSWSRLADVMESL